ncbi:hypothetical protein PFISCL1PPCAC_23933, partial [Pristionchus fissidentatus]
FVVLSFISAIHAFNMPVEILRPQFLTGLSPPAIDEFHAILFDRDISFTSMLVKFREWAKRNGIENEIGSYILLQMKIDDVSDRFYSALVKGLNNYIEIVQVALSNN